MNLVSFLKAITPVVTPVAAVFIAAFAAVIAFFQWRTNRLQAGTNREKRRAHRHGTIEGLQMGV